MKTARWATLVMLLAAALVSLVVKPAWAEVYGDWGTIPLTSFSVDEPRPCGDATMTDVRWYGNGRGKNVAYLRGTLSVTCHGLTPRARYTTPAGAFKTDQKGDGAVSGEVHIDWWPGPEPGPNSWTDPYVVDVVRVDATGATVLIGVFPARSF
jgi:hypothetical protein